MDINILSVFVAGTAAMIWYCILIGLFEDVTERKKMACIKFVFGLVSASVVMWLLYEYLCVTGLNMLLSILLSLIETLLLIKARPILKHRK